MIRAPGVPAPRAEDTVAELGAGSRGLRPPQSLPPRGFRSGCQAARRWFWVTLRRKAVMYWQLIGQPRIGTVCSRGSTRSPIRSNGSGSMSLLMHGRMQLLNSPTAELSFGDARGRTCLPPARPGCCGAALLLISDAGGVDGPSMADRSVAQKAQRGGGGRWPDFFRGVRGAGEDARHALTRPDQTQSNGRRSPPVAVAADDHTEKSVSPEPRILLPAGSAQLDEDRTLCSHALCCAGCHAPAGGLSTTLRPP